MGEPGLKIVKFFGVFILLLGITFSCGKVEESVIPDVDFAYTMTVHNVTMNLMRPGQLHT